MDTFDAAIGERIPWFPDETLFSWCSRFHCLAVNGLASATCLQLFGRRRQGVAHDFPSGIEALANRVNGSLGTASEIIRDRTILAFYAPFRSTELIADVERQMCGDGIESLKYRLGLLTSGLGAAHPLKACVSCMRKDHERFGVPYWHRTHQLPSAWFCPLHAEPLFVSPLKLDQRARFQWVLPLDACLAPWLQRNDLDDSEGGIQDVGIRLAELGGLVCALPAGSLANSAYLAETFRSGLARRGWVSRSGRAKWASIDTDLRRHALVLSTLPPMAMQIDLLAAQSQLGRILSGRTLTHPLRYLAWMPLLFDSWLEFQTAFGELAARSVEEAPVSSSGEKIKDLRPGVAVALLRSGQNSATSVARSLGVTVTTIASWAAAAGILTPRRPKVINESLWLEAVQLLADGHEKAVVADKCCVSVVSVTRILRSVPGLQACWHRVRLENARDVARRAWLTVAALFGSLGIAAARKFEPAAYAWLYRNDIAWLRQQNVLFGKCRALGNHSDVRSRRADERYARGLKLALHQQVSFGGTSPTSLSNWIVFAPGLRKVFSSPENWPQTTSLLQAAMILKPPQADTGLFRWDGGPHSAGAGKASPLR